MPTLTVDLGPRSYPIHIGPGLLDDAALLSRAVRGRQVLLVTNTTVAPLYLARVSAALADRDLRTIELPDGEEHKTLAAFEAICTAALDARFDRDCSFVALGGGVVGDLTGFAAASYQRGVDFVQLPTTLLAQVDSSVGGKTGVNHALGKNMIGAFHQPSAVIADVAALATLPPRELSAGLAEVIKYGLIRDPGFLDWIESSLDGLRARDPALLTEAVLRSCRNKAEVVGADEREAADRALLNLGHTFGHAIETAMGYGRWLHGEAVGAGMCMAAEMSARLGWLGAADAARVARIVGCAGLPTSAPAQIAPARFLELMALDKKSRAGRIRLVLLAGIGRAVLSADYEEAALRATLEDHHGRAAA
ncbi:MAG: 3-dehydroquinate synthase [Gammaproteobacteria bacterium]